MTPRHIDLMQHWALALTIAVAAVVCNGVFLSDPSLRRMVRADLCRLRRRVLRMVGLGGRNVAPSGRASLWRHVRRYADRLIVLSIICLTPSWCVSACLSYWRYLRWQLAARSTPARVIDSARSGECGEQA